MKATRKLNRRSFVAMVIGGAAVGGGATALVADRIEAQGTYTGVTDSDTGQNADRPGYGRGVRNQYTDRDTGPNADPQFHGRGPNGRPQGAPAGQGAYDEPASNCNDSDAGSNADPGGRGRTCNPNRQGWPRNNTPTHTRHCSDSDSGGNADPLGGGQRC